MTHIFQLQIEKTHNGPPLLSRAHAVALWPEISGKEIVNFVLQMRGEEKEGEEGNSKFQLAFLILGYW